LSVQSCRAILPSAWLAFALSLQSPDANSADNAIGTAATVHHEVLGLLDRLVDSGCVFYRNGSWYEGAQAASHLKRKFDYIAKRRTLRSAEQFIELGASRSSFSGRAYQVRCGSSKPEASAQWLLGQLMQWRQATQKPSVGSSDAQ